MLCTLCCVKVCYVYLFPWRHPHSYGEPGVEFTGLHKDTTAVTQIHFLPGQVSSVPVFSEWKNGKKDDNGCQTDWLMTCLLCDRVVCCHCWMTTQFTFGSWWPRLPGKWEGLRERTWSVYRKWAATASQEDLALRAAGTWEPVSTVLDMQLPSNFTRRLPLHLPSSSQCHSGDCPPLAEVVRPALHWNRGRGRVLPGSAPPLTEGQPDAAPGSGHAEVRLSRTCLKRTQRSTNEYKLLNWIKSKANKGW